MDQSMSYIIDIVNEKFWCSMERVALETKARKKVMLYLF